MSPSLGRSLLHPRSVALIGASDDPTKTGGRPLAYLRRAGFSGAVYAVNPRRGTVQDVRAYPSLDALPEVPDHAFILTPTEGALDAVAACAARGVPLATVLAGGFAEEGEAGRAREAELRRILAGGPTRLLGPNSIGIVNVATGLSLTANGAFAEPEIRRGSVFVASHSGSMIGAILSRGLARGLGFAGFVSTGSEVDLSLGEICAATLDDPAIEVYALFLESIVHGADIRRFAVAAAARGKPVIAYKLGRSAQGAELSQSHTGAIAGEDGIADAFLRDCGIARVETLEGLIEGIPLIRRVGVSERPLRPKVAVVTTTGGGAAMVVDQLGLRGIEAAVPSEATMVRLADRGVVAPRGRILDLTLAGTRPAVMSAALETVLAAPEFDLVVAVAGSSARFQPDLLVPAITAAATAAVRPLVAFAAPDAPQALAHLAEAGIPSFRTPEACGDAIAAVFGRRPAKALPPQAGQASGEPRLLDEAAGYAVLVRLGLPVAAHAVVEAGTTASPIGYPVAVKLLSAEVLHKTELGGVALGIRDDVAFRDAAAGIAGRVSRARPGLAVERLLVQTMASGLGEVLLSVHRDADAGLVVMLAAGGVLAEIHQDRSLRLGPLDHREAVAMIDEVKALRALAGYRGRERGDLDALADALVALSACGPEIVEAEINPLVVRRMGEGVIAVDAVVRVREDTRIGVPMTGETP
ncbi:Acyl-CoA synthetase (NDP forming) [Methylobacterium sp. ap11]|uniref:acetate--CoA ligase family protein n=1 Tax=Methylobacterium sp. ap11 TaxID=1761799 RepID=UPI0008B04330|nr:acetate--CoA ligase family protein [Methylobacterium sp. ap11]SEP29396.1 Acyl-CoA synthetase (NDP forming) [Methylobacterium sp. ap11]